MNTDFDYEFITPNIGAEVTGLDLTKPFTDEAITKLKQLWLKRKVLVFYDQKLGPVEHVAFTRLFGEVDKYPFLNGIDGHPLVAPILKLENETVNFGGVWHSDTTYLEVPAGGGCLNALELPPVGGDTLFANMNSAYESLSDEIKQQIDGLYAVNSSAKPAIATTRKHRLVDSRNMAAPEEFNNVHPVVRTHPETGEKILYINEAHTVRFADRSEEESQELLNLLFKHALKPEFQCRLRWSPDMVIIWDNRSSHHYPVNDYHGHRRLLHRVSLKGQKPV